MNWLRLYSSVVHDPKVQRLSAPNFKLWINLLCLANDNEPRGVLPSIENIAFALRMRPERCRAGVSVVTAAGLFDATDGGLVPHNWNSFQYKSDDVTARVKRFRNVAETPPDTDTDTEQSSEPPRQSEIDSSSPPQAAFRTTVTAFYEAPQKRKVGALIDMATSLGIERSGMAAALIRDFGAGKEIVDALKDAASEARGDPWEYMRKVLGNVQEAQVHHGRLNTNREAGGERFGVTEILTEEEAYRLLRESGASAGATVEGRGGAGSQAQPED